MRGALGLGPYPLTVVVRHRTEKSQDMKSTCCERYKRKGKACKKCPTMAQLSKKEAKQLIKKTTKG